MATRSVYEMDEWFRSRVGLSSGVLVAPLAAALAFVYGLPSARGYPTARLEDYAQTQERLGTTVEMEPPEEHWSVQDTGG